MLRDGLVYHHHKARTLRGNKPPKVNVDFVQLSKEFQEYAWVPTHGVKKSTRRKVSGHIETQF